MLSNAASAKNTRPCFSIKNNQDERSENSYNEVSSVPLYKLFSFLPPEAREKKGNLRIEPYALCSILQVGNIGSCVVKFQLNG